ncbi:Fe-S cluster assembly ATPase SufC [Candidatus Collierbacteria bacterium]|nr:Fe-S cluster assembly ATPase SufC [Candidatus Collierbacteria bacterium]
MNMLKINNLFVTIDGKEIVKGVTLTIKLGEIHALMGPNGSGKSSLAMALMGHPRYQTRNKKQRTSTVELDGEDITVKTPDERARMGLFLAVQYPVGVEGVTVEQLLWRSLQEKIAYNNNQQSHLDVLKFRKDLEKLAKKVGVKPELLRRGINVGFSGGEKKRLEVLQMLVLQPKYAILDETDSGLDIDALLTIAENIKSFVLRPPACHPAGAVRRLAGRSSFVLQKPGILVITHYAKLLQYLQPDYVHIMKNGRIVETGGKELAERIEKEGYK